VNVFKIFGTVALDKSQIATDLADIDKQAQAFAGGLEKTFVKVSGIIAGAFTVKKIAEFVQDSIKAFAEFETATARMFGDMQDLSETAKDEIIGDIRTIAEQFGISAEKMADAANTALDLDVPKENLREFLAVVSEMSIVMGVDANAAASNLATTVKLMGKDFSDTREVADLLFVGMENGHISLDEMASGMARLGPLAKGVGVDMGEVVAALIAVKAQGQPAKTAISGIQGALIELNDSTSKVNAVLKDLTGETFGDLIADGNSLGDVLSFLSIAAAESGQSIDDMFSSVEAGKAVLTLTTSGAQDFRDALDDLENKATTVGVAYGEMADTIQQKLNKLSTWWQGVKIDVGEQISASLQSLLDWLGENEDEIAAGIAAIIGTFMDVVKWLIEHRDIAVNTLAAIAAAFAGFWAAANPVQAAVLAIITAISALLAYKDKIVEFWQTLSDAIGGTILGWLGVGKKMGEEVAKGIGEGTKAKVSSELAAAFGATAAQIVSQPSSEIAKRAREFGRAIGLSISGGIAESATPSNIITESREPLVAGTIGGVESGSLLTSRSEIKRRTKNILDDMQEFFQSLAEIGKKGSEDFVVNLGHGLFEQLDLEKAHKAQLDEIHQDTLDKIGEAAKARDDDLVALDEQLKSGLILQEDYEAQREEILANYLAAETQAKEAEKGLQDDAVENLEKNRKSMKDILWQALKDMLSAMKEELLLKAAKATAEAIAMTFGLNPLAVSKWAEAGGYALGAGSLAIAGFERGGVFDRPTVIPPSLVAEGGYKEAFVPLSPDTFRGIGRGLQEAMREVGEPVGATIQVDMRGLFEGATVNVRDDADITAIARETYDLWRTRMRAVGREV